MTCLPVNYLTQSLRDFKTKTVNFCISLKNEIMSVFDEFLAVLGPPIPPERN